MEQKIPRHEDCWAKTTPSGQPGISVEQHCRTTGIVANLLTRQCLDGLGNALGVRIGVVLAALHDIGKVAPGFQGKCAVWRTLHGLTPIEFAGTESDHAKVSQKTVQQLLASDSLRFWAAVVGAHHGQLKGDSIRSLCDGGEGWGVERRRLAEKLIGEFGSLPDRPPTGDKAYDCGALWFNAGLIAVADWLASDERSFPPSKELDAPAIRERAEKQLDRIGFRPVICPTGRTFADLFPFPPNSLQEVLADAVRRPGIYVVEATMGGGKTEAALMAAYNLMATGQAAGIYFALPTQVTSNRIHERVAAFIEKILPGSGTRLIHGNSWLMEPEQPLSGTQDGDERAKEGRHDGRDWFASSRRALLAPFGVGTVDQALLGVVAAKHFFVRQYALAGKVVVLDEVHSYDLYTGTLLDVLVMRLRELGATVIVLSATLTAARRRQLLGTANSDSKDYPLLSGCVDGQVLQTSIASENPRTVQVRFKPGQELADAVLERAERGECVLWIRNTVNDAQETYKQLCGRKREGGPEIGLLHARFPQFRREELEGDWLDRLGKDQSKRPFGGCVLVSTQVAEQSVDIDADLLVTDLAPTDMLLQRLGRLWRHERLRPAGCITPETWIASPGLDADRFRTATASEIKGAFGKSAKVYAPYVLLRAFDLWRQRTTLSLPADIRQLLEATYAETADEPCAWRELREDLEERRKKLQSKAFANSTPWQVTLDDEEGVQTRWNSCPTVSVLIVQERISWDGKRGATLELLNGERCELRTGVFDFAVAKAIHRNMVKVPRWCVTKPREPTPIWLKEYVHDDLLPCKLSGEKLSFLPGGGDSGLTYRNDLGVVVPQWQGRSAVVRKVGEEDEDESYDW